MNPVLFGVLPTWSTFVVLGMVLGTFVLRREALRAQLPVRPVMDAATAAFVASLAGARLLDWMVRGGELLAGGWVWYGGLLPAMLVLVLVGRRLGLDAVKLLAAAMPAVALGLAFGRLGCLGAGCCHGRPTLLPWGIALFRGSGVPEDWLAVPLHPSPLYEAWGALALFAWTSRLRGAARIAAFFGGYGVLRFLVEFTRGDAGRGGVLGLSTSQWLGAACVLGALGWWWRR